MKHRGVNAHQNQEKKYLGTNNRESKFKKKSLSYTGRTHKSQHLFSNVSRRVDALIREEEQNGRKEKEEKGKKTRWRPPKP